MTQVTKQKSFQNSKYKTTDKDEFSNFFKDEYGNQMDLDLQNIDLNEEIRKLSKNSQKVKNLNNNNIVINESSKLSSQQDNNNPLIQIDNLQNQSNHYQQGQNLNDFSFQLHQNPSNQSLATRQRKLSPSFNVTNSQQVLRNSQILKNLSGSNQKKQNAQLNNSSMNNSDISDNQNQQFRQILQQQQQLQPQQQLNNVSSKKQMNKNGSNFSFANQNLNASNSNQWLLKNELSKKSLGKKQSSKIFSYNFSRNNSSSTFFSAQDSFYSLDQQSFQNSNQNDRQNIQNETKKSQQQKVSHLKRLSTFNFEHNNMNKNNIMPRFNSNHLNNNVNSVKFLNQPSQKDSLNEENQDKDENNGDSSNVNRRSYKHKKSKSLQQNNQKRLSEFQNFLQNGQKNKMNEDDGDEKNSQQSDEFFDYEDGVMLQNKLDQNEEEKNTNFLFQENTIENNKIEFKWLKSLSNFQNQIILDADLREQLSFIRDQSLIQFEEKFSIEEKGINSQLYSMFNYQNSSYKNQNNISQSNQKSNNNNLKINDGSQQEQFQIFCRSELDNQNFRVVLLKGEILVNSDNALDVLNIIQDYKMLQEFFGFQNIYKINQDNDFHIIYSDVYNPLFKKPIDFLFLSNMYRFQNKFADNSNLTQNYNNEKNTINISQEEKAQMKKSSKSNKNSKKNLKQNYSEDIENQLLEISEEDDTITYSNSQAESSVKKNKQAKLDKKNYDLQRIQLNNQLSGNSELHYSKIDNINKFQDINSNEIQKDRIFIMDISIDSEIFDNCIQKVQKQGTQRGILLRGVWIDQIEKIQEKYEENEDPQQNQKKKIETIQFVKVQYLMEINYNIMIPVAQIKNYYHNQHTKFANSLIQIFEK
ncbi:hypothetical protein PPERSA_13030 [Pseudocohnilembus persalinus]|uniref:Uncharacterized protein n=1 Tax=Pseudocohnilembus persalinus TaxID=266149 RepID=A0A0V0R2X9_PSEPJ|nr:hypothetical protein PPERSA_13030 [Pseudocohnilembus persalinus]|eukprot:KRX08549.1 hypothetical protein PPERSA_13030 [Pseudocohnilembus persalinus]